MKVKLKALAALLAALFTLGVGVLPTFADGPNDQVPMTVADGHSLVLTPPVWTTVTGLLLPFLVAFLSKASASKTVKAVIGILLASVAAVVERATQVDGSALISQGLLIDIGMVYGPQLLSYLGFYSHVNLNAKIAPNFGIG